MPGHVIAVSFHACGLLRFDDQKGQVLHWFGLTGYITHIFFLLTFCRKIQSFVRGFSTKVVRRPLRFVYFLRNLSSGIFRKSAMNFISCFVAQINPSPGPLQQLQHCEQSKCRPAIYHLFFKFSNTLFFSLLLNILLRQK